jgi:lysine 2,3-aminomutase
MSSLLARTRITVSLKPNAHVFTTWSKGLATTKSRAFHSSTKPMGSAGLAHAPSSQTSSNFIYDRPSNGTSGTPFHDRMIPTIKVPISKPAPPLIPSASTLEQDTVLEARDQSHQTTAVTPVYYRGSKYDRVPYWQNIRRWKDVEEQKFLSYRWNVS